MCCDIIEQFILGFGTSSIPAMLTLYCFSVPLEQGAGNVCFNSYSRHERPGGAETVRLRELALRLSSRATETQNQTTLSPSARHPLCVYLWLPRKQPSEGSFTNKPKLLPAEQRFYSYYFHTDVRELQENDVDATIEYTVMSCG